MFLERALSVRVRQHIGKMGRVLLVDAGTSVCWRPEHDLRHLKPSAPMRPVPLILSDMSLMARQRVVLCRKQHSGLVGIVKNITPQNAFGTMTDNRFHVRHPDIICFCCRLRVRPFYLALHPDRPRRLASETALSSG